MLEGDDAERAIAEATKRTISRRELGRHERFEQISPQVGQLDEDAVAEGLDEDPDATLALLADLVAATDSRLRELARRLAGRLMVDVARRGPLRPKGIGRLTTQPYRPDAGDLDLDASLEGLVGHGRRGLDPADLRVRSWARPGTALCLLVDRSGSMGGGPLATAAVAAAAIVTRSPRDCSVLAFGREVVVVKPQDIDRPAEQVVEAVLSLRGFGTTDVAGALFLAGEQLARSRAGRRLTVLLSDCRATVAGDVERAARALDELVILAPTGDDVEARTLATTVGARVASVSGPSQLPDALAEVLDG